MMKKWPQALDQMSGPGLPGVWQPVIDFSFSLLAHDVEAGEEERREGKRG